MPRCGGTCGAGERSSFLVAVASEGSEAGGDHRGLVDRRLGALLEVAQQPAHRDPRPETRIARGDLSEEIGRIKREPGNDLIAYGGATFNQALSRLGLVDEYRPMIQPAALGSGLSLFKDLAAPLHLELVEATTFESGVAIHVYRPRSTPVGQPVDPDQTEQVG
jgi:riboflavin biosynthesis pyrimidine reductase